MFHQEMLEAMVQVLLFVLQVEVILFLLLLEAVAVVAGTLREKLLVEQEDVVVEAVIVLQVVVQQEVLVLLEKDLMEGQEIQAVAEELVRLEKMHLMMVEMV